MSIIDTTPDFPAPLDVDIESAAKNLVVVLRNMPNETDYGAPDPGPQQRIVLAQDLVAALSGKQGHEHAASAWAIHRLIQRGLLVAQMGVKPETPVIDFIPDESRTVVKARRFFGSHADDPRYPTPMYGEQVRKPLASLDRPVPYECLLVRSTPALWDWERQLAPNQANSPLVGGDIP